MTWGWGGDGDDPPVTKSKPAKGEAFGLSHHLLKLLTWMIGLRLRGQVEESHVCNMLYSVLKAYRSEGNKEVGMHYAQKFLDRLHKKSWWKSVGSLKDALAEPNEKVLESLRIQYPRPLQTKGREGLGKGVGTGKGNTYVTPKKTGFFGNQREQGSWNSGGQGSGRRVHSRSPAHAPADKGKDESKGKGDKSGGKDKGKQYNPRVQKAFSLAAQGKITCPYWQSNTCRFPDTCKFRNECYLCGSTRHGAQGCPDLESDRGKKRLGL